MAVSVKDFLDAIRGRFNDEPNKVEVTGSSLEKILMGQQKIADAVWLTNNNKIEYYKDGKEDMERTGGWVELPERGDGTQSKEDDFLSIFVEIPDGSGNLGYVTDKPVDLTFINTLTIDWENTGSDNTNNRSYINVRNIDDKTNNPFFGALARIENRSDFSRKVDTLDVSNVTGFYHIQLAAGDARTDGSARSDLKIYELRGEI